jgi:ferri-bacillibactin esterase
MQYSIAFVAAALAFWAQAAPAQSAGGPPLPPGFTALASVTGPAVDRYRIQSRAAGKPFIIDVTRIDTGGFSAPTAPGARLPVVFVTDAGAGPNLVATLAGFGTFTAQLPAMIVVGIGQDTSSARSAAEASAQGLAFRGTDFTAEPDDAYVAGMAAAIKSYFGQPYPANAPTGRAAAFLAFIDKELKPFIAARYPANIEDSTLVGDSLGALFTLHVLFTSPNSFSRYIAISPSQASGSKNLQALFPEEAALGDVHGKRLFLGLAGRDNPDALDVTPRLDANITAHARPGLRYTYKTFPDEAHATVAPVALWVGLRAVFDPPQPLAPPASGDAPQNPPK